MALVTVGVLVAAFTLASVGRATPETFCIGRSEVVELSPGVSMKPSAGTGHTVVTGAVECTGPIEEHQPTGPISTTHFFNYGYAGPDTCTDMEIKGWVDYSVPTATGLVVLRNHFTETVKPLSDPSHTLMFNGDRFSGRALIQSAEGDCVTSPLTRLKFGWIGHWHGPRATG